ncbi:MAG: hypothetical protein JWN99_3152, partial [Ilumatobacteraceae bacterium]|nr:hypothetical protein [Ilumatobacteraceae bacterium]
LIADVDGYFTASSRYTPAVPGRLLDTRPDTQVGYVGAKPAAGAVIHLQVTGSSPHLAPIGTAAVVLNITGTEVEQGSYVNVFACGTAQPFTSSLNLAAGSTASNLVIAPVAPDGTVCLFTLNPAHLIADISGWFPAGSSYAPVVPDRLLDTREAHGFGSWTGLPAAAGETIAVGVIGGRSEVPTDATAVIVDVVGLGATVPGYITVWPCGAPRPLASNLNLQPGDAAANSVLVGIGAGGTICLYSQNGAHLIVDIFGYDAPR